MSDIAPILNQILARLAKIELQLGANSSNSGSSSDDASGSLPPSVRAFDAYLDSYLTPFVVAGDKLGGDAKSAAANVSEGWKELRKILLLAANCKEPAQAQLPDVLKGISAQAKAATAAVKRNEWEKHTKTVSEGFGILNWVVVKPAPRDFMESFIGGSDYWANSIRKEYRTTNPDQMAFVDTFKTLLQELIAYVKDNHLTGLKWNANGVDYTQFDANAAGAKSTSSNATATAAPAKAPAAAAAAKSADSGATKGALFAALSKEGEVTTGLKKVTKDMQTWRAEYKSDAPAAKGPAAPAKAAAPLVKGPPKLEFQDGASKWLVENQTGPVTIDIKDKRETVYVLNCVGATIDIRGKCKSIVVDACKKTDVLFDVAMASVEVVNCQRINVRCRDTVSAVAIDKTDGIVVHLPTTSLTTEIVASKSSEMNLSWPDANGEIIEKPIPEQYVHRIKNGGITANVSDLYTH